MLLPSAKEFAYRIKMLTKFAYEKQICWIVNKLCEGESIFALSAKNCWFADRTSFIGAFVEISYKRQICWITDIICLRTTDSLNCWHNFLTDNKFAELPTKFADMNLLLEFADWLKHTSYTEFSVNAKWPNSMANACLAWGYKLQINHLPVVWHNGVERNIVVVHDG